MWFGESWGAPICEEADHTYTPVGDLCVYCQAVIAQGDRGFMVPHVTERGPVIEKPWHRDCFLFSIGVKRP